MLSKTYSEVAIQELRERLSKLTFVDEEGNQQVPTKSEIEKMLTLCKKRNRPSYYKLRHASGLSETYTFLGINMYSDDGKKMRRFESGLDKN
jgi:hypothetical protein